VAAALTEATKENFREIVAQGRVVVDVWGPQCAPCIALMPDVEALAETHPDVKFVKLDSSQARRLCMELRVMGLPAFLLFEDGREMGRISGQDVTAARLRGWLDDTLTILGKEGS
jgi:thioredoxin-like negative regulator of GroEL